MVFFSHSVLACHFVLKKGSVALLNIQFDTSVNHRTLHPIFSYSIILATPIFTHSGECGEILTLPFFEVPQSDCVCECVCVIVCVCVKGEESVDVEIM